MGATQWRLLFITTPGLHWSLSLGYRQELPCLLPRLVNVEGHSSTVRKQSSFAFFHSTLLANIFISWRINQALISHSPLQIIHQSIYVPFACNVCLAVTVLIVEDRVQLLLGVYGRSIISFSRCKLKNNTKIIGCNGAPTHFWKLKRI